MNYVSQDRVGHPAGRGRPANPCSPGPRPPEAAKRPRSPAASQGPAKAPSLAALGRQGGYKGGLTKRGVPHVHRETQRHPRAAAAGPRTGCVVPRKAEGRR